MNPEDLKLLNKSLSESVNLFQSIHVLQSKEDELAFGNETSAGKGVSHLDPCMDYFVVGHRIELELSMKQLRGQFRFLFLLIRISNEL